LTVTNTVLEWKDGRRFTKLMVPQNNQE
jgi:hypothetical protein